MKGLYCDFFTQYIPFRGQLKKDKSEFYIQYSMYSNSLMLLIKGCKIAEISYAMQPVKIFWLGMNNC